MNYITNTDIEAVSAIIIEKIKRIEHLALDMDGTIYNGKTLFPFTIDFLRKVKELGIGYSFLTNNASINTKDYVKKLRNLGIEAKEEDIYTSAHATIHYLQQEYPEVKRLFLLGTPSMIEQFEHHGFISTSDAAEDEPDAVIVAFDKTLTFSRLSRAAWWAKQGKPYFATNPDKVCPTDQPTVLVDCGAVCSCIETATGRWPDKVLGKPRPEMLNGILRAKNLKPNQIAMIGDRIYTDMKMAERANAVGILVLSGEATLADAEEACPELDLVIPSIKELGELMEISLMKTRYV